MLALLLMTENLPFLLVLVSEHSLKNRLVGSRSNGFILFFHAEKKGFVIHKLTMPEAYLKENLVSMFY